MQGTNNVINRYRVLVADDDAQVRQLVVRALESKKLICDQAEDGLRALELVADGKYDVVVTDLRMPHLQGSTLVASLLNLDDRPAIVVITGVTQKQEIQALRNRDIEGIFSKPIDPAALAEEVKAIADRRQALWRQKDLLSR
jgi:CheY-like chemotaxis protein